MNQIQLNHLNMCDAVVLTLNSNASIWSSNPAISAVVTAAQAQIAALNGSQTGQINNSKAFTLNKASIKTNLLTLALLHADAGRSFAAVSNNVTLKQELKISQNYLFHLPDGQLGPYCQNIYNLVNPMIGSLASYGVSAATIAALQAAINAFLASVGQPHSIRSGAKAYTISIENQIQSLNTLLKEQLDPMLTQYKTSNALFYNQYKADRKLPHTGHRITVTIKGVIYDEHNHPLKNAHVSLVNSNRRKKVTKVNGVFMFARLKPGTYIFSVTANGYNVQTKTITVNVPHTVALDFTMVVTGSGGNTTGPNTNTNTNSTT